MIKGIFLGLGLGVFFTSLILLLLRITDNLHVTFLTGATIYGEGVIGYSSIFLFISLVLVLIILRKI
jgi:hypothetical protein